MQVEYHVIVGNIGTVYAGPSKRKANAEFKEYVALSKAQSGRVSGENVTILNASENEIIDEFYGTLQEQ